MGTCTPEIAFIADQNKFVLNIFETSKMISTWSDTI